MEGRNRPAQVIEGVSNHELLERVRTATQGTEGKSVRVSIQEL
jgi:hypothetical protein